MLEDPVIASIVLKDKNFYFELKTFRILIFDSIEIVQVPWDRPMKVVLP
jgi:hypothetical protein